VGGGKSGERTTVLAGDVNEMSDEVKAYIAAIQNIGKNETANLTVIGSDGYGAVPPVPGELHP
jgi:hypothetical protein